MFIEDTWIIDIHPIFLFSLYSLYKYLIKLKGMAPSDDASEAFVNTPVASSTVPYTLVAAPPLPVYEYEVINLASFSNVVILLTTAIVSAVCEGNSVTTAKKNSSSAVETRRAMNIFERTAATVEEIWTAPLIRSTTDIDGLRREAHDPLVHAGGNRQT